MTVNAEDIRDRLGELWTNWGLSPDVALGEVQLRALGAVAAWLEQGATDPEVAIRAVQILLADPERPGWNKRASWIALRRVLKEAWANAGTGSEHLLYGQTLLLAAWPNDALAGWLSLAQLMDSACDEVMRGRERQRDDLARWRMNIRAFRAADEQGVGTEALTPDPRSELTLFQGVSLTTQSALQHVQNFQSHNHYPSVGPHISQVLHEHHSALNTLATAVVRMSEEVAQYGQGLAAYVGQALRGEMRCMRDESTRSRAELNLLWWGQARYCRVLKSPYRRLRSEEGVMLWCAAREAAQLSLSLEVEPAAAYLVETLHALDQDISEKKPLFRWMEGLLAALRDARVETPPLSRRLEQLAKDDALGLPVTWVRLQAAVKEPLTRAADAVALDLDLDAEIDRGQWASWLFRETLLDLRIADSI
ncbi:GTPase-associated system all-helical protein GASH [Sorangium sp. So ce388]|uniref:GTPase-associated system all-helical protein GASH n=1 Tax=Sorangium sp. So ce388 TaxID=3133309 RepID=UPI003F5B9E9B